MDHYIIYEQGYVTGMKATNQADAVYRYDHEVIPVRKPRHTKAMTRSEYAKWYVSCHEFKLYIEEGDDGR